MEDKITEILIIIMLLILIIAPFLCIYKIVECNIKKNYIEQLEEKINKLEFEQEYLEFVYEDNIKQNY